MKLVKILIFKNTTGNEYFQFHAVYMTRMDIRKYKPEAPIRTVANKTERKNESTLSN